MPTVATIPCSGTNGLPEEDGWFDMTPRSALAYRCPRGALAASGPSPLNRPHTTPGAVHTTVAVVAYPRISNLDEFQPLKNVPGLRL